MTTIEGGVAGNVVPDRVRGARELPLRADANPGGGRGAAARAARARPTSSSRSSGTRPPGPVVVRNPLVERLRVGRRPDVGPKQAWTPVAEFAEVGVDAVNFGPGDPQYAHRDDERVEAAALVRSYEVLRRFLRRTDAEEGRARWCICRRGSRDVEPYPFEELDRRKREALDAGRDADRLRRRAIPRDETPAFIREALRGGDRPDVLVPARRRSARAARGDRRPGSSAGSASRSTRPPSCCPRWVARS